MLPCQEPAYCTVCRFVILRIIVSDGWDRKRCLTFRFSRYGVILVAEQGTSHGITHYVV